MAIVPQQDGGRSDVMAQYPGIKGCELPEGIYWPELGTYLPTTRNFFPMSSFRIDDSRVGIAESTREDIHTFLEADLPDSTPPTAHRAVTRKPCCSHSRKGGSGEVEGK